jgi:FAD/FMN-containing dehydrogenase
VVCVAAAGFLGGIISNSPPPKRRATKEEHDQLVLHLASLAKGKRQGTALTIRRNPAQSHCARPHAYKEGSVQLDVSSLNKVLSVEPLTVEEIPLHLRKHCDELAAIVDVQAMCSFEDLVDELLPLGLIPAVVPEFKGITIGGSLQGLAAESTSFKYGFVHDVITGFEVLLGDGTVLWCSPKENQELFHSLPGSFGSLALCTRIRVLCLRAKSFVRVSCREFDSLRLCLEHMWRPGQQKCDMVEGIGFGHNSFVAVKGVFETAGNPTTLARCNAWGHKWFYSQVKDRCKSSSSSSFLLPTKDYLFRHDRGSFWMASYRIPQIVGQYLMGSLLDNSAMFHLANLLPWAFPKKEIVLQDFMLPRPSVEEILHQSIAIAQVWPVWLLPMKNFAANETREEKTPVFGVRFGETNDLCNVGVYGIPSNSYDFVEANKRLEAALCQHGGRKVYYSHSFYEKDFFYENLYNGKRYRELRERWKSLSFPEIWDKVVVKNGQL